MASNYARTVETGANQHLTPSEHDFSVRQRSSFTNTANENINANQSWQAGESTGQAQPQVILKTMNEACLMKSRRVFFNHKTRNDLEHACEDKVSKYKLEEVHTSMPSSNKSTFIMTF